MSPRQFDRQGPALCEDDEEDSFEDADWEGGFYDEADEDQPEYEWDEFYFFDDEDE